MKSILRSKYSPKLNTRVTFGVDIVHEIPNRLELLHMGELKKVRINRFKLELDNDYKKVGRFDIKRC